MQKCAKIGKFLCLYYWPALGHGRYHKSSYMLVACCWRERWTIKRGRVSSHHNYGKRMRLTLNKEIQSGYYQNMLVSIKGALLKWVNMAGTTNTSYFSHWSDNSKQDTAKTTRAVRQWRCDAAC